MAGAAKRNKHFCEHPAETFHLDSLVASQSLYAKSNIPKKGGRKE
jgi:hypothetical protein